MKLIISTTGAASPEYLSSSSTPDIEVPQVEDIRYSRRVGHPEREYNRESAHIDLTGPQAVGLVTSLLMQLVDEDVIEGWNLSFPESEPVSARGEAADDADEEAAIEAVYGDDPGKLTDAGYENPRAFDSPVYEVPQWGLLGVRQAVTVGKAGVRYQRDTSHAGWIRREAKKRGLKASVQLGDGIAHVLLTQP